MYYNTYSGVKTNTMYEHKIKPRDFENRNLFSDGRTYRDKTSK